MDVGERGIVPKHLHIHSADEVLLHLFDRDVRLVQASLQDGHLIGDDLVFLLLRAGLADSFYEVEEFLAEVTAAHLRRLGRPIGAEPGLSRAGRPGPLYERTGYTPSLCQAAQRRPGIAWPGGQS
eukprot:gnl/TRDRNA2_/TRDRNA2_166944_c0_seq1.p1 gnl/TRDRNA2_/TRDRNA2_166944_c0~~gnl/TRDRNA2_/TRDRNA2_166944_c0_seq1.p1  ORF type:complete len:138 (+),score=15.12 gnl/TRDRNA2_/TRDRNA2_166944_c0_seq1:41-415(+)